MSDITYELRKMKTKTTTMKRAKSVPTPQRSSKKSIPDFPPVVTYGSYNGSPVIVFGEIHNMIDNKFYENLDTKGYTIMVEHASTLCKIAKEDKYRLFNILRGSDWIWYKYASRNKPIVCLDNRIEIGLPTAIEEKYILNTVNSDELHIVMECVMRSLKIFTKPEIKLLFVKAKLTPNYTNLMNAVKQQIQILLKAGSFDTAELLDTKNKLVQNIMKLAGILVDINVMDILKEHTSKEEKPIMIFMGAAHAYRLKMFFPDVFTHTELNNVSDDLLEALQTVVYE